MIAVRIPKKIAMVDSCRKDTRNFQIKQEARTQMAKLSKKTSAQTEKDSSYINSPNIIIISMHKSELSSSLDSIKYKIVLLGDSGVGKSSIIDRFVKGEIDQLNQPTVGIDFISRNVVFGGKAYRLQLWDTAGQQKYKSLVPAYLRDANCGLLVFEINRKDSFDNIRGWLNLFREHAPSNSVIFLLANKSDIIGLSQCEYADMVETFREKEQLTCIETSAKNGSNVNLVFETMIGKLEGQKNQNDQELQRIKEEESQATNFFLKYNRTTFDLKKRKNNCCFI